MTEFQEARPSELAQEEIDRRKDMLEKIIHHIGPLLNCIKALQADSIAASMELRALSGRGAELAEGTITVPSVHPGSDPSEISTYKIAVSPGADGEDGYFMIQGPVCEGDTDVGADVSDERIWRKEYQIGHRSRFLPQPPITDLSKQVSDAATQAALSERESENPSFAL